MKLSIIVPVYNAEKYLCECLDSLINQTIADYEIILVNDGSRDSSMSILTDYQARYPKLIRILDIDNGGQGRARNRALDIAEGEYIGFADSDDYVSPDMFEKLVRTAEDEKADICVCDAYKVENGKLTYLPARPWQPNLKISSAGSVWNKVFRRDLIGNARYPEGLWYEDFEFSARMLLRSLKTVFISEGLYYYRSGHTSTMRNQNAAKNLDMIEIFRKIEGFADEEQSLEIEAAVLNHILLDSINRVNATSAADRKAVIRKLREYTVRIIPDISKSCAFRAESRNRRIIMWLNYHGLEDVSKAILRLTSKIRTTAS